MTSERKQSDGPAMNIAGRLSSDRRATLPPSLLDAAGRDLELAEVHTRLHGGFFAVPGTGCDVMARAEFPRISVRALT